MPLFMSIHRAPGLAEEEVRGYGPEIKRGVHARFRHAYMNLEEGFIVSLYEAALADDVQNEFDRIGWPSDTTKEVQFELDASDLDALPTAGAA